MTSLPVQKNPKTKQNKQKNIQSDFECHFGSLTIGSLHHKIFWMFHSKPVHTVRAVSLGVALGAELHIMFSQSLSNSPSLLIVEMLENIS